MKDQQVVFATNESSYYQTSRSKYDPSIVQSKRRDIQLSYRVCNQIYKGKSVFIDPEAEKYYNQYMKSKQQYEIDKSLKTDDCSQLGQSRRNQYQKIDQKLSNFGPLRQNNKQNLNHLSNQKIKSRRENRYKQNKMSLSFCDAPSERTQKQQRNLFKTERDQERIEIIVSESENLEQKPQDTLIQVKKLQRLLKQKEKQLTQVKKQLEEAKKRQNRLLYQTRIGNQKSKIDQKYYEQSKQKGKNSTLRWQLGGTAPALLYMTLFMVLLTKQKITF